MRHKLVQQIVKAYEAFIERLAARMNDRPGRRRRPRLGAVRRVAVAGAGALTVDVVTSGAVRAGLGVWLASVAPARRGELTMAIVPDARVRALNRRYRRKDRATDVLSFPAGRAG